MHNIIYKPNMDVLKAQCSLWLWLSHFRQHLDQPSQGYKRCSWLNKTKRVCKRIPEYPWQNREEEEEGKTLYVEVILHTVYSMLNCMRIANIKCQVQLIMSLVFTSGLSKELCCQHYIMFISFAQWSVGSTSALLIISQTIFAEQT